VIGSNPADPSVAGMVIAPILLGRPTFKLTAVGLTGRLKREERGCALLHFVGAFLAARYALAFNGDGRSGSHPCQKPSSLPRRMNANRCACCSS
jgi:hypothetical protein